MPPQTDQRKEVEVLVTKGASIDMQMENGWTALVCLIDSYPLALESSFPWPAAQAKSPYAF